MSGTGTIQGATPPGLKQADGYVIGDRGRAAVEVGAGVPATPACWPDSAVDAAHVEGLEVRAASVRGVVHRLYRTPRQDCYSLVWHEDSGSLVVTVCDGVGAFDLSHEAAELAARRLAPQLQRDPGNGQLGWAAAFAAVSAEIDTLARARGAQMATTVVSACITAAGEDGYRAEVAWVGDSAAYLLDGTGWQIVGGTLKNLADDDVPLTSATAALPASSLDVQTCTVDFAVGTALFLMTDGVADPLGDGHGEVGQALAAWWSVPPEKFEFAKQAAFARRSFDDDRTVVGVWAIAGGGVH